MTEDLQTRDEPGEAIQARLERTGVLADLARLPGHQRAICHEALERAHVLDRSHHLGGAKWLTEIADGYQRGGGHDQLVGVLRRAADAMVRL